ncbi:pyridoxamine 5'-phosphate oxidase family protein [Frankia sp. Cas4]|uniref:pyridoxamine 5'-phosphate oxidase family protein n=1 Tax=Frankia sp. Cas4 TaxID=3073927 RepID=UPI002AD2A604|nr:pyridoxamine 5'-phosphate oxidase family protein [Frankia sp. Cas4]
MSRTRGDQIRMSPQEIDEFLHGRWSAVIGSNGPHGIPHLATVSYGLMDGRIVFSSYAKAQKIVNLRRDSRVTCLVEDLGESYGSVQGVLVYGRARLIEEPDEIRPMMKAVLTRIAAAGRAIATDTMAERVVEKRAAVLVEPDRVLSWDHRRLDGAY